MKLGELLKKNREEVNCEIKNFLPGRISEKWLEKNVGAASYDVKAINEFLTKPVWDFLDRGGKRWRPLLMFLACGAVGGNPKTISKFAAVPELIHNGTLIADDIEDSSATRRGKQTIHLAYGTDIAVNLGSLLYYLPLQIVKQSDASEGTKISIYEMINDEMLRIHFGQGTDIWWHKSKNSKVTEKQYFSMCANKTGTLARLSAKLGAILGNGTEKQSNALGKFAESIGVAFQIQDDILNLEGGLGKDFGEDITEGKMSLPVIRTLSVAGSKDRKMLRLILEKHTSNRGEIRTAISIISRNKSIEYSKDVAGRIVVASWKSLEPLLEDSEYKTRLHQLAGFMTERKH